MVIEKIFLISAFSIGLIGTLIVTFSSRAYSKYIELSLQMHEVMIHQLIENHQDQVSFQNMDKFRKNGAKAAKIWFVIGLFLILASFGLHLFRVLFVTA